MLPDWYRTTAAIAWRFLVIVAAAGALIYALHYLRVVVLPIIIALLASTLLLPVVRWLKQRNVPDALAAAGTMLAAFLLLVAIGTAVAPSIADQFGDLRPRAEDGARKAATSSPTRRSTSARRTSARTSTRASIACARTAARSPGASPAAPWCWARSSPAR